MLRAFSICLILTEKRTQAEFRCVTVGCRNRMPKKTICIEIKMKDAEAATYNVHRFIIHMAQHPGHCNFRFANSCMVLWYPNLSTASIRTKKCDFPFLMYETQNKWV